MQLAHSPSVDDDTLLDPPRSSRTPRLEQTPEQDVLPLPRSFVPADQDDRVRIHTHLQPLPTGHRLLPCVMAVAEVMAVGAVAVALAVRWWRCGKTRGSWTVAGQLCFAVELLLDGDLAVGALRVVRAHVFREHHAVRLGRPEDGCLYSYLQPRNDERSVSQSTTQSFNQSKQWTNRPNTNGWIKKEREEKRELITGLHRPVNSTEID